MSNTNVQHALGQWFQTPGYGPVPGHEITRFPLMVTALDVIGRFFSWKHCYVHRMRALEEEHKAVVLEMERSCIGQICKSGWAGLKLVFYLNKV